MTPVKSETTSCIRTALGICGGEPFPYRHSSTPAGQCQALYHRTIMRRACSKKQRPVLLAELEPHYLDGS